MTIDQINEGQLVTDGNGNFAVKKYCIHNNPYYANVGGEPENPADFGLTEADFDNAPIVSDWDEVSVEECCG